MKATYKVYGKHLTFELKNINGVDGLLVTDEDGMMFTSKINKLPSGGIEAAKINNKNGLDWKFVEKFWFLNFICK